MTDQFSYTSADDKKLAKEIEQLLGRDAFTALPEDQQNGLKQQYKLLILYPSEFVVFRDHWQGEGNDKFLKEREVLCHSRREDVARQFLANLPDEEAHNAFMEFVESAKRRKR